ncbi:hypothetical protein ACWT_2869 [Actinoplanes sp. SE50]|uniref:GlsB/YeaQ/YmgE family stress response membrane protein n=1 Tax=unclassified Actinoplanes TaxID=2626549 RepID=UPI00023EC26A|nr:MULTISPECIES: GlsB/YeaQ/YmgE family stress response membrane protein [unclassified Actinoplanes]AEV83572.1 ymge-like uncharacterized protein [Actinoplanes sp. SE50/110]ATO82284.1 hypothetical protein ACWT_2869 [Actinoplanes sp. SE50]SLL99691.1 hypothetical protein ACSP50_2922 [Actinoplanes sp. SE50/110]
MNTQNLIAAIVFGAIIGVVARIVLPGRQNIGLIATVLVGMGAAVAGTWVSKRYDLHSTHFFTVSGRTFDWAVVGVQVGIAVLGVGIAAMLARAFSTDHHHD